MRKKLIVMALCGALMASNMFVAYADGENTGEPATPTVQTSAGADNSMDVLADDSYSGEYSIVVNGKELDMGDKKVFLSNDRIMIPVRIVAEALGFNVTWNNTERSAGLDDGTRNTVISIGLDNYYMASSTSLGMSAPVSLGAAPKLENSTTYAPAGMFNILYNNGEAVTVDSNGVISITSDPQSGNSGEQTPNPFVKYETLDEAKATIPFDAATPADSEMPEGYELTDISVMDGSLLQLVYTKPAESDGKDGETAKESKITYRTAQNDGEDISGDYNEYKNTETVSIDGYEVTLRGNENIAGAVWTEGQTAFSVYADAEITEDEMKKIVISVNDSASAQMPNPFVEYETLEEAEAAVSFDAMTPADSEMPEGYELSNISVMDGNLLQLIYSKPVEGDGSGDSEAVESQIRYRTAANDMEDISGDYNEYENVKTVEIDGHEVTLRGNENIADAVWKEGDIAFSIYADTEITEDEMTKIIKSIK